MLLISASVYVLISWNAARSDLSAELAAAKSGGLQTVRSAFEDLPRSDHPRRDLRQLVATFEGNRHLIAQVQDSSGRLLMSSNASMPREQAPRWFAALLHPDVQPVAVTVPGASNEVLSLEPQPASDIAALWSTTRDATGVFALAAAVGLTLIYWIIRRALSPLIDLSNALAAIGASGYRERVEETGPPELRPLQSGFNAMAERLAEIDARNRALEAQLLTIQDEERADIARDLHDEIGPHLFAVALDADMINRSLTRGDSHLIPEQIRSIQGAVSYMQRQVRELIARLRPTRAAELGLEAAICDLIAFWQARQPDVEFAAELDQADANVPEPLRDVIYHLVQEAVANALRHARTERLDIAVTATSHGVTAMVANRGVTKAAEGDLPGLGLASMRERVQAAGGILEIHRGAEGWTVAARFLKTGERLVA
ncbi:MAG TPA: histidine kinase [Sphingomicrobium sp.]|nr:histidine kinase [Sphingomicrobium sp.]